MRFVVEQLGFGALVGAVIGLAGGWLLGQARRKGWMAESLQQLGLVALPLLCVMGSEPVGGSMFIAGYVAGIAVQVGFREAAEESVEFTEGWGRLLDFFVFFLFGMLVALAWKQFNLPLAGVCCHQPDGGEDAPGGDFPHRNASERRHGGFHGLVWSRVGWLPSCSVWCIWSRNLICREKPTIKLAVMATVLLSIFAHGFSTLPGIGLYARKIATLDPAAPEHLAVADAKSRSDSQVSYIPTLRLSRELHQCGRGLESLE